MTELLQYRNNYELGAREVMINIRMENGMENGWNYDICKNKIKKKTCLKIRGPKSNEVRGKGVQFLMCVCVNSLFRILFSPYYYFTYGVAN